MMTLQLQSSDDLIQWFHIDDNQHGSSLNPVAHYISGANKELAPEPLSGICHYQCNMTSPNPKLASPLLVVLNTSERLTVPWGSRGTHPQSFSVNQGILWCLLLGTEHSGTILSTALVTYSFHKEARASTEPPAILLGQSPNAFRNPLGSANLPYSFSSCLACFPFFQLCCQILYSSKLSAFGYLFNFCNEIFFLCGYLGFLNHNNILFILQLLGSLPNLTYISSLGFYYCSFS